MIKILLILGIFLGAVSSYAQNLIDLFPEEQEESNSRIENVYKGTKLVNTQSANLVDPGLLILNIQHRFGSIKGGAYEFFGLDQAEMRLGFEYGLSKKLNIGIGRSTYQKTYDAFLKTSLAEQSEIFPFVATLTVSGYIPTIKNYFPDAHADFSDKVASHTQLQLVRNFKGFAVQVSPSYMFAGFLPELGESKSFAILTGGLSATVSKRIDINLEYIHHFTDMISGNSRPLSVGIDIDTGGHLFQLIFSNSQGMTENSLYKRTTGDWSTGNVFFGFNLIRNFYLKQP